MNVEFLIDPNNILYWRVFASIMVERFGSSDMYGLDEFQVNPEFLSLGVNALSDIPLMKNEIRNSIVKYSSDRCGSKDTGIQFSQTVFHLIQMASIIALGQFDITPYLPLTKSGSIIKNRKIELVDGKHCCVHGGNFDFPQRLKLMMRTCGSGCFTPYDSYSKQELQPNQVVLGLCAARNTDKPNPILNFDFSVSRRYEVIKKEQMKSGVVYTSVSGVPFLYVGKAHSFMAKYGNVNYFIYVRMSKVNKKLFDKCNSVSQLLTMLNNRSIKKNMVNGIMSELVTCKSYKKMISVANDYPQLQGIVGKLSISEWEFYPF